MDVKEKLNKTKGFIEKHKTGIKFGLILIPLGTLGVINLKLNHKITSLSEYIHGYRTGFKDGLMTLSIGIDEALKNNDIQPELCKKLAEDSAKVVKPIVQTVLKD